MLKRIVVVICSLVVTGGLAPSVAGAEEVLPSILWLTTGEAVLKGTFGNGTSTVDEFNSAFVTITAKLVLVEASATGGMADEGAGKALLEGVESGGHKCFTEGDSLEKGTDLVPNPKWHLVLDLSHRYMILLTVPEYTIKCDGALTFKVKGSILTLALNEKQELVKSNVEASKYYGVMECEAAGTRKAKWREYDNHEGTMTTVKLEANGGLGWEEVCEEIKGFFPLEASLPAELMEP